MAAEKKYLYATPAKAFAAAESEIEEARKSRAKSLSLIKYGLEDLPESIAGLTKLERLDLDGNRLTTVPVILRRLTNLRELDLRRNQLATLPDNAFAGLAQLQELYLQDNDLTTLREGVFAGLAQLQELYLHGNRLTTLPEGVYAGLARLQQLSLFDNGLTTLPEGVFAGLVQLQQLYLHSNGLTTLPRSLEECSALNVLLLHDNPVLGLSEEVLGPLDNDPAKASSPRTILAAWRAMQRGGRRTLNEAKVILVGRGGAGKTTLRKVMMEEAIPDTETRTDGIELSRFDLKVGDAVVGLNVWDFGGQEVMYSTHRFFLTSRSLYLLVLDARSGPQDENVDYWLRVVEELGKAPPVLVVLNHVDENRGLSLDETGWRAKYPFIAGFVRTCAKTREGLQELLDKMSGTILTHLPEARADFPAAWFSVKDKLTEMKVKMGRDHLKMEEYDKLCVDEKIPEDERFPLLCLVRDLGLVSCYPEVPELKDLGVLRPDWLTDGLYGLITNEKLKEKGGRIRLKEVSGYLRNQERYAGYERFLLDAAGHFRLGFEMTASKEWLFTALLSENTPENLPDWLTAEGLKLEMRYRVLPEGLVAQFISVAHELTNDTDLRRWRNGTELRMDGATALVQGDVPARRIRILVQGPPGQTLRALLSCIRHHFRTINAGLTPPEEYVPVPNLEAEPVRYGDLLARENQNRRTIEVTDRQSRVYDVEVTRLLNHYVPEADWTREAAELKAGLDGVHTRLDRMAGKMGSLTVPGQSLTGEEKALPPRPLPGAVPFYKSWNAMAVISGLGGALVAGGVPLPVWLIPWRWMIVLAAGRGDAAGDAL
ncbi:MAG TPA: COR domain-containing protein [Verrucomicrobiales bacterium]|nr:COR domain-containing protein [Verrucomicrobiales bacterium]